MRSRLRKDQRQIRSLIEPDGQQMVVNTERRKKREYMHQGVVSEVQQPALFIHTRKKRTSRFFRSCDTKGKKRRIHISPRPIQQEGNTRLFNSRHASSKSPPLPDLSLLSFICSSSFPSGRFSLSFVLDSFLLSRMREVIRSSLMHRFLRDPRGMARVGLEDVLVSVVEDGGGDSLMRRSSEIACVSWVWVLDAKNT